MPIFGYNIFEKNPLNKNLIAKKSINKLLCILTLSILSFSCEKDEFPETWHVSAEKNGSFLEITARIADYHGDFIHMSIRKKDYDNNYSIERSPSPGQPERDWSRVHYWFGELNPDTYLEGRIDDGSGDGPYRFTTYKFQLPISSGFSRRNYEDLNGSDYEYITEGYSYADGNFTHPGFSSGTYEIVVYPWYTGKVDFRHTAIDGEPEVQYIHYESLLASAEFAID